jgi:DNA-binding response OmpR family regulator
VSARILIVEGEDAEKSELGQVVTNILSEEGYDCALAQDPAAALAWLAANPAPSLILFDVFGRGTGATLPQLLAFGVPVVVLAISRPGVSFPGAAAVLFKPFDMDELLGTVKRYA